jgi:hypothetical protein
MPWGNLNDDVAEILKGRAAGTMSDAELDERFIRDDGRVRFRLFGAYPDSDALTALEGEEYAIGPPPPREVTLIDPEDFDYEPEITADDEDAAQPIDREVRQLEGYFARDPGVEDAEGAAAPDPTLPPVVDHRPNQSPVKSQGGRGTCVSHASMGLLEAHGHIPDDLSEQYTHFKFNVFENRPQNQDNGLRTTEAARHLSREDGRISLEQEWPYIGDQAQIDQAVDAGSYGPPAGAEADQTYGYSSYKLIGDTGIDGESIKNTRFLESLLALGFDIVIGTWVSWDDTQNRGVLMPLLDANGQPIGRGGHAMLVVGYDRPNQYFVIKNSWGPGWGHAGYGYFHYDFVRSCLKYGFTVSAVVPGATIGA